MAFRAFVAVPVPALPELAALAKELEGLPADLNVARPDKHHLTLSFLGDVPDGAGAGLAAALDEAVSGEKAFALRLRGVGAFPDDRRPRVVWAGAEAEPAMARLAKRVRERLAAAGFPGDDKPFKVHLTLARARTPRGVEAVSAFVRRNAGLPLPELPVREVRLHRSTLHPAGAVYETLHAARLGE